MYFVSSRSLISTRETQLGASRSLADFYQRREQHCSRPAAFKNATVRERPEADICAARERSFKSISTSGTKLTSASWQRSRPTERSFNDLVRARPHRLRYHEANLSRRFEVHHQLHPTERLHRQVLRAAPS